MELNVKESYHFGSPNLGVSCKTETKDAHVVLPDGTVKRCQINKNRQFPFFHYEWAWNDHHTKIIGVKGVTIKPDLERAGFRFLRDYYVDEGNEKGYEAYCRREATCDSIANRSAEFKAKAIPPVEDYLPKAVVKMQEDNKGGLDFGSSMFESVEVKDEELESSYSDE